MECQRLLLRLALVACVSIALGAVARPAAASGDPSSNEIDALVDVGGHRLYVHCIGRGGPTVILEAGLGNPSGVWDLVQPAVAGFTTVCSYDRAGRGQSEPGPKPRTSQTAVDELKTLLQGAGIRGPYVLVGHSVGGWHSQLFARQDGGRLVTGIVLVDATPLDWPQVTDSFGLPTPTPSQNPEGLDIRASAVEVLAAPEFPNIPLVTLGRTVFPPAMLPALVPLWEQRQVAYATLSCRGEFVSAPGAGHFIHRDRPDLVIAAIERVVQAAHPTDARQLHRAGHAVPATHQGDAQGSRWDHCPS